MPGPEQGIFDTVPRVIPPEYWWAWAVAFLSVFSLGFVLMALPRTRRAATVYLVLVAASTTFQMMAVRSYEYHRWDTGDSRQFAPQGQGATHGGPLPGASWPVGPEDHVDARPTR